MKLKSKSIIRIAAGIIAIIFASTLVFNDAITSFLTDTVSAEASNGFVIGSSGTLTVGSFSTADSGIVDLTSPLFRVSLYRNEKVSLKDENGLNEIYNKMKYGQPENCTGYLYFMKSTLANSIGSTPLGIASANTSNKTLMHNSTANDLDNIIVTSVNPDTTGIVVPGVTDGVYFNLINSNFDEFCKNWKTYTQDASNINKCVQAWSYIFLSDAAGEYHVNDRLNQIFNPDWFDTNNMSNLSKEQVYTLNYHWLDMLLTLYTLASNTTKLEWEKAVIDFIDNSDVLRNYPISICIDTAELMVFDSSKSSRYMLIVPTLDYLNYSAGVESEYAINGIAWWAGVEANNPQYTNYGGNSYSQLLKSIDYSIAKSPTFVRITDYYQNGSYTNRNNGFSFAISALLKGRLTTYGGYAWLYAYESVTTDYFNLLSLSKGSVVTADEVYGYMLIPVSPKWIPTQTENYIELIAKPDNKIVTGNTLGEPVKLTVYGACRGIDKNTWYGDVNKSDDYYKVTIDFAPRLSEPPGITVTTLQRHTVDMSPMNFYKFITGEQPISVILDNVAGVDVTDYKGQKITFTYTISEVEITRNGGQVCQVRLDKSKKSDTASFIIQKDAEQEIIEYYSSTPEAYSELKNYGRGSNQSGTLSEDYDVMAGVPSTEQLYFAAGGSEFIVDVAVQYVKDEVAKRTYYSRYSGTDCEFRSGDTAGNYTVPSPSGASSSSLTINAHNGGTVTATWTGTLPWTGSVTYFDHGGSATNSWDYSAYEAALAQANAWAATVNSYTISFTSASDKKTRSFNNWGVTVSASSSVGSAGWFSPGQPYIAPSYDDDGNMTNPGQPYIPATGANGTAGSYTITATGSIPAGAIDGPCCDHVLPEIIDTWSQSWQYDSMKIVDVHIWTIDQAAVNGLAAITSQNVVGADIRTGRPTIYYNIALKNDGDYTKRQYGEGGATHSSTVNRVRYSYLPEQNDIVILDNGTRTNKCDGAGTTNGNNVSPAGGNGHSESWATGFRYNSFDIGRSTTGHTRGYAGQKDYPLDTPNYLQNHTDEKDKNTAEYQKFLSQRQTNVSAVMITDILILQTSSGDQAVLYYDSSANPKTATAESKLPELDIDKKAMWDNNANSAAKWKDTDINVGGYNGNYSTPASKFNGTGNHNTVATYFDSDPARNVNRPARPSARLMLYSQPINMTATLQNKAYIIGEAEVYWANSLNWSDKTSSPYAGASSPWIANNIYSATSKVGEITGFNFGAASHYIPEGPSTGGYIQKAPYSKNHQKINNLIVHDPVSVEYASLVSLPNSMDQRTSTSLGSADALKNSLANNQVCPREPALCEFRSLNCTYFMDKVLLDMDFDTVDASGNPINKITGNSIPLTSGFTIGYNNNLSANKVLNAFGTRMTIPFSELGQLDYYIPTTLRVEADVLIPVSGRPTWGTMLFSFMFYDFYIPTESGNCLTGTINTGNAGEKWATTPVVTNTKKHITIDFSFSKTDLSRVYVDGVESGYIRENESQLITEWVVGNNLYIGCWGRDSNYPAYFYLDNLKVTRLAGTSNHTVACYRDVDVEPTILPQKIHVHSVNCLNNVGNPGSYTAGAGWFVQEYNAGRISEDRAKQILGGAYDSAFNYTEYQPEGGGPITSAVGTGRNIQYSTTPFNIEYIGGKEWGHWEGYWDVYTVKPQDVGKTLVIVGFRQFYGVYAETFEWPAEYKRGPVISGRQWYAIKITSSMVGSLIRPFLYYGNQAADWFLIPDGWELSDVRVSNTNDLGGYQAQSETHVVTYLTALDGDLMGYNTIHTRKYGQLYEKAFQPYEQITVPRSTAEHCSADMPYAIFTRTVISDQITTKTYTLGERVDYGFTGYTQSITLPKGIYQIETWGAEGGDAKESTNIRAVGGRGGYATGVLVLNESTNVYINVGGKGIHSQNSTVPVSATGGFNGGGDAGGMNWQEYTSGAIYGYMLNRAGGGGATDLRIGSNSLNSRAIVAGGGGGGCYLARAVYVAGYGLVDIIYDQWNGLPAGTYTGNGVLLEGSPAIDDYTSLAAGGGGYLGGTRGSGGTNYIGGVTSGNGVTARVAGGGEWIRQPDGTYNTGRQGNGHLRITVLSLGELPKPDPIIIKTADENKIRNNWSAIPEKLPDGSYNPIWNTNPNMANHLNGETNVLTYTFANGLREGGRETYGPNVSMKAGIYKIELHGSGLANVGLIPYALDVTWSYELGYITMSNVTRTDNKVTYYITISNDIIYGVNSSGVEFCTSHIDMPAYYLDRIEVRKVNTLPYTVNTLICNEPHHKGMHYDTSSKVCWKACGNDDNHKKYKEEINTADGSFIPGNFLCLDYAFQIYFPNIGDFEQGQSYGLGELTSQRGLGYTNYKDTGRWTKVKKIQFDFNVIYNGQLYRAGEWITLGDKGRYLGANGSAYSEANWSNYGTVDYNGIYKNYYDFYCVLANYEAKGARIRVQVEAINSNGANDNMQENSNKFRGTFSALHGCFGTFFADVVGRIGNLVIEDTGDYRYSNFFKDAVEVIPIKTCTTYYGVSGSVETEQAVYNFEYTGDKQTVTLPAGRYRIEAWGASGGDGVNNDQTLSSHGGLGGYAKGEIEISTPTTYEVYVGGQGTKVTTPLASGGGFNGGGNGGNIHSYGGGGASDVRTGGNRILVAGGGGGADNANTFTDIISDTDSYIGKLVNAECMEGVSIVTIDGGKTAIKIDAHSVCKAIVLRDVFEPYKQYRVVFDAWTTVAGDVLHVDAFPDTLPEKLFTLTTKPETYSMDLYSTSPDMNRAAFRMFIEAESNGEVYITNVKIYEPNREKILGHVIPGLENYIVKNVYMQQGGNIGNGKAIVKDKDGNILKIFNYTGDIQTYTVPSNGKYTFELYGASGGSSSKDGQFRYGGQGGITIGTVQLSANETVYVVVGGQGGPYYENTTTIEGGYNGGQSIIAEQKAFGAPGGGATDIRVKGTSINNRILVAGGGGGANTRSEGYGFGNGGHGGGLIGGSGTTDGQNEVGLAYGYCIGTGGTQLSGGTNITYKNYAIVYQWVSGKLWGQDGTEQSGAGGGYYSGAGCMHGGAGGGSSFANGYASGNGVAHFPGGHIDDDGSGGYGGGLQGGEALLNNMRASTLTHNLISSNNNIINTGTMGDWIVFKHSGDTVTTAMDVYNAYNGMPSLRINQSGFGDSGVTLLVTGLTPNTDYTASMMLYIPISGTTDSNGILYIVNQANTVGIARAHQVTATNGWEKISVDFNSGTETAVWVRVTTGDIPYVFVSDFSLRPKGQTAGLGGTQTSGYALGQGENVSLDTDSGGAGGGYYGGFASNDYNGGGGGGSSYIAGLSNAITISGNTTMPNPKGGTMVGNKGHGYVRITALGAKGGRLNPVNTATLLGTSIVSNNKGSGGEVRGITVSQGNYRIEIIGQALENGTIDIKTDDGTTSFNNSKCLNREVNTSTNVIYTFNSPNAMNLTVSYLSRNNKNMIIRQIAVTKVGNEAKYWEVEGVVRKVDASKQKYYMTWSKDIRGAQLNNTVTIDTYSTRSMVNKATRVQMPLEASVNDNEILKTEQLRVGYPIYFDITTLGNYFLDGQCEIQVVPYYFALNLNTKTLIPVDAYFKTGSGYKPVNIYNKVTPTWDGSGIYNYTLKLDWENEKERRNYTDAERVATEFLRDYYSTGVVTAGGQNTGEGGSYEAYKQLDTPSGNGYILGNAQFIAADGHARTFIGGETTNGILRNLGGINAITRDSSTGRLYNAEGRVEDYLWWQSAQRWHLTLGLPSATVFVTHGVTELNTEEINKYNNDDYVIVCTCSIIVIGNTYVLEYKHTGDNGRAKIQRADGTMVDVIFPDNIPPVLAIYSSSKTSALDLQVVRTH